MSVTVFNYGSINLDQVYRVPHFVQPGETLSSLSLETLLGGKGANQSVALARAGADVRHVGRLGRADKAMLDGLRQAGVDVSAVTLIDGASGHAIIQVDDAGENAIVLHGGANQSITAEELADALATASDGDWLLLQNECNDPARAIEQALDRDLAVAFNPAPMDESVQRLPLDRLAVLFLNETEAEQLVGSGVGAGGKSAEALAGRMPETRIVLTLGAAGARLLYRGERIDVDAFRVSAVDTTAAGDTFVGYYLAALGTGLDDKTALRRACAASAVAVTRQGATPSIPLVVEVEEFLDQQADAG